jgi:hypothetical protein
MMVATPVTRRNRMRMPALSAPAVIPASPSIGRTDGLRESDSDTPFQDVAGNQGDDGATAYQQDGDPPAKSTPRARPGTATPRRRSKARVAVTTDIAIPPRRSKARAAVMTVTAIPPRPSKARAAVMTITAMPPRPSKVRAAVTTATAIRPRRPKATATATIAMATPPALPKAAATIATATLPAAFRTSAAIHIPVVTARPIPAAMARRQGPVAA